MSRNTLGPVAYSTYEAFCGWVDPSMPTLNRFDFVTYLHSNFPDAERSASISRAIDEYRATLQEIVDAESALVNLRSELVRPQLAKEQNLFRTSTEYAAIERGALDSTIARASTALRQFESTHIDLRLKKAELEFQILSAEAPTVKERLSVVSSPNDPTPFFIPEVKTRLTQLLANPGVAPVLRTPLSLHQPEPTLSSSVQQVEDFRDRAPSLSHSVVTVASSRPPLTPHTSPRKARPVRTPATHLPGTQSNK